MSISKSTSSTKYNKQASPYMYGAADSLNSTVNANAGNLQELSSGMAGIAGGLGARLQQPSELVRSAQGYGRDVFGGKYLGGANPYLNDMVGQAREGTFGDVASRFGRSGMSGSTGFAQSLGRGLSEAEMGLRFADYNQERGRMDNMAGNVSILDNADLGAMPYYLQAAQGAAELPYTGERFRAQGLGALLGSQQKTTQKQALGPMLIQGASNAARAFAGGG
jgi:hypothetical protein